MQACRVAAHQNGYAIRPALDPSIRDAAEAGQLLEGD